TSAFIVLSLSDAERARTPNGSDSVMSDKTGELAPPPQCLSHQSYYWLSLLCRKHCVEQRTAACVHICALYVPTFPVAGKDKLRPHGPAIYWDSGQGLC